MIATLPPLPVETTVGNYFISNYPPYSTWQPELIPEFESVLTKPPTQRVPLSLYVHLPFGRQRCHYCYFRVYPHMPKAEVDHYIASVLKEFSLYRDCATFQGRPFESVYFGGGTPSYLSADQVRRLLSGLQDAGPWCEVEECTFECEPGTITREKLQVVKQLGVTRITLGFQSLNDDILERNGRWARAAECLRAWEWVRELGFPEVNLDLMAGMAGETDETWRGTVQKAVELRPDCATIYQMELTYNSLFYADIKAGKPVSLADWPTKRRWLNEALQAFEAAGYAVGSGYMAVRDPQHWRLVFTVNHFWHGADLLALGESAFGHLQGVHYQNVDTFQQYTGMVAAGRRPLRRARRLTGEEKLRRELVLQLKTGALDAAYFRLKFNVELTERFHEQFALLSENELLEIHGDDIRLTRTGLLQVDWLLPNFYLPEHVGIRYT
jgi:oxygen-independent coproporphyrinogen-3 oxidase